ADGFGNLYQYRKMPQGFKNSSAIFQRGMNIVLQGLINKVCLVYLDDILIFGETLDELKKNEQTVKNCLDKFKLIVNDEKIIWELWCTGLLW
ncbi:putative LTR transposable element, partial [Pseudoloma neurophilia]